MKVTMVTEGAYPQSFGGVSVWCDQIVRGLPDHHFEVNALTITGNEPAVWSLPENVSVVPVPLWGQDGTAAPRADGSVRIGVMEALRRLLGSLLMAPGVAVAGFTAALRDLHRFSQGADVRPLLRGDGAVGSLLEAWRRAPGEVTRGIRMSVHDALTSTDILEHWLRPLLRPAPRGDVTHAVSNGLAALVALGAKWAYGTPMLLTEHGVYLRERYLTFRGPAYSWPVKVVLLAFLRRLCVAAYRHCDLITPGNRYNRRWEVRCGARADRIVTVYNGVDPAHFAPAGREPEVPTVSWAGRIDPIKDLETLLRAFAEIRAELPDARLRIFGGTPAGSEAYRERCVQLAGELDLADAVAFEGRVENIRDAYAAGHVVVLSSISEGFPYTLIEAMTSGRATVSTDVGGVSEAVADTGLVVPPRDPAAMGAACLRLLRDDLLRHRLAGAARKRALELFTVDRAVDAFQAIYADLAAAPVRGRGAVA